MRRLLVAVAVVVTLVVVPVAAGDGTYQTQKYPFTAVAAGEQGSGFIENIHANGPIVYAHEQYVLRGASPETTYGVTIHVSGPTDTTCAAPLLIGVTAMFTTNPAGNGAANHAFTPADIGALRGSTIHVYWTISTGTTLAYTTACETIQLD